MDFFREHRLRHQLQLANNQRLNALAEPLLQPGALERFFEGGEVKPSVLHGGPAEGALAPRRAALAGAAAMHGMQRLPLSAALVSHPSR